MANGYRKIIINNRSYIHRHTQIKPLKKMKIMIMSIIFSSKFVCPGFCLTFRGSVYIVSGKTNNKQQKRRLIRWYHIFQDRGSVVIIIIIIIIQINKLSNNVRRSSLTDSRIQTRFFIIFDEGKVKILFTKFLWHSRLL